MKLIKDMLLVAVVTFTPIIAHCEAPIVETTSHYVVSPGTRLMAGDRKLNEFYILGARSANPVPAKHVGVKSKIVKKESTHKMKVALKRAFGASHHHVAQIAQRKSHVVKTVAHRSHRKIVAHHSSHSHVQRFAERHHGHKTVIRG